MLTTTESLRPACSIGGGASQQSQLPQRRKPGVRGRLGIPGVEFHPIGTELGIWLRAPAARVGDAVTADAQAHEPSSLRESEDLLLRPCAPRTFGSEPRTRFREDPR